MQEAGKSGTAELCGVEACRTAGLSFAERAGASHPHAALGQAAGHRTTHEGRCTQACFAATAASEGGMHQSSLSSVQALRVTDTLFLYSRHGAEQYTGDIYLMFYGYHLERAIPRIQRPYTV